MALDAVCVATRPLLSVLVGHEIQFKFTDGLNGGWIRCRLLGVDFAGMLIQDEDGPTFFPWHTIGVVMEAEREAAG